MDIKNEWKKLLLIIAVFAGCFYLPVGFGRFNNAVTESLYLVKWYAREHVLLCLVPAFFIAGAIASFVNVEALALKYNINTQYEQGAFDFEPVRWLSADASNVVYQFYTDNYEDFNEDEIEMIEQYYFSMMRDRNEYVRSRAEYRQSYNIQNWREFNIADMSKYNAGLRILQRKN